MEARYEEIINHLHKALSSTEEDEQDFKVSDVELTGTACCKTFTTSKYSGGLPVLSVCTSPQYRQYVAANNSTSAVYRTPALLGIAPTLILV